MKKFSSKSWNWILTHGNTHGVVWRHKNTHMTLDGWKFAEKICQLFDLRTISTNIFHDSKKLDHFTNFYKKKGLDFVIETRCWLKVRPVINFTNILGAAFFQQSPFTKNTNFKYSQTWVQRPFLGSPNLKPYSEVSLFHKTETWT